MTVITISGLFWGYLCLDRGFLFVTEILLRTHLKDIHLRADFDNEGNSYGIKAFQEIFSNVFDVTNVCCSSCCCLQPLSICHAWDMSLSL